MQIIALASAENQQLHLRLNNEQQTSAQLKAENRHQLSILSSSRLSFLWSFCSNESLQCSRCIPGWIEHASRCFFLSKERQKWETARLYCLDMGGDLATVRNAEYQAFLTNLTYQFKQMHPQGFHSAWICLQDFVKEGLHRWVSVQELPTPLTNPSRVEQCTRTDP
ncbi:hypothetical protein VZT92_011137 [Zoarces viviparus]|uniref:C-type lectin domain-containing protein n=1 Tax=Zoarces viviparus TaxID=48416 RepID=A0AAW1FB02_ZOAVI